jgi:ATP-binding cassette subfamily C (CFTR/MRP) protein 1
MATSGQQQSNAEVIPTVPPSTQSDKSLEEKSNWWAFIFMTYLDPIFAIGYQRPLELEDLGAPHVNNRADNLHGKFFANYDKQKHLPLHKRSLWHALWLTVGYWRVLLAMIWFGVSAALQLGPVLILNRMVKHFEGSQPLSKGSLWVLVALLFVFPMLSSMFLAHSNAIMANIGAQVRNTLIDVIYRKSLTISSAKRHSISTGRIITMFSDDTNQIRNFLFFMNNAVLAPFQIGACLYLIYQQVGAAVFVGLGYSICVTPITGMIFGAVFAMRKQKMVKTDGRVKLMNEVLNGIRIIKYYAWENAFVKKISEVRREEVMYLKKMGYLFNIPFAILLLGAPQIQTVLIFLTYIGTGHQLDAATAFTTLTLFGIMTSPFIFLPFGLQQYSQSLVSMRRIMEYLDSEDIKPYVDYPEAMHDEMGNELAIQFDNVSLAWVPEQTAEEKAATEKAAEAEAKKQKKNYKPVATTELKKDDVEEGKGNAEDVGLNRAIDTLSNVTLNIKKGELVGVVGTVGSGKSSVLSALLGEMHLKSGRLSIQKGLSIAYCDQRPWIVNATVRDNILFGRPYDELRFNRAIHVAAMEDDLKILAGGLMTEIGERGINLSGGQKARVCLARAVYNDADIYLLDDPLSAVDAHVGEHIFHKCVKEALSSKTVILVTHHLHVLPQCDRIVILDDNGSILTSGSFDEIMNSGIDVERYLRAAKKGDGEEEADEEAVAAESAAVVTEQGKDSEPASSRREGSQESTRKRLPSADNSSQQHYTSRRRTMSSGKKDHDAAADGKQEKDGKLITKEERNDGDVKWETYWSYIQFGGVWAFFFTMLGQVACQVLQVEANFWLADWGKETTIKSFTGEISKSRSFYWFRGYAGMLMASVFFLTFSRTCLTYHRTEASAQYHETILRRVLYFPISFFDVTPIGRILNRFSQDMATVDEDLAQTMSQVISMIFSVLGAVGAIAGSTKGTFLILMIPLGFLYRIFNTYFRKTNTAIARLEAVSRSPIYADFSQTLSGTITIRAYGQSQRFIETLEGYANTNTVPGVLQQVASQWLAIRLDLLGAIVMFFMGALTVSSDSVNFIPAGYLGLGLSYAIQMTALLKMMVRVTATMEAQFNAVERIRHYAVNIDVEAEVPPALPASKATDEVVKLESNRSGLEDVGERVSVGDIEMQLVPKTLEDRTPIDPPADWPQHGEVEFVGAKMRYRTGPLVLKGVSFKVNQFDKIGIAGRTGCGKSSLMVALFRIEELAEGKILIDGLDISRIPLSKLRSKLCIIPQDPVMFSASVRFNLDPFNEYSDEEVWTVLDNVNMKDHVLSLPNKLDELVAEGGDNFSAGQRQLICIGRAILRKPKILVMDEATASIDAETDDFIQRMIRLKFKDCTVLTIAHRLHTIIDSTKVLVMDGGVVGEYDSPEALLAKENGQFKALWERHVSEGGKTGVNLSE